VSVGRRCTDIYGWLLRPIITNGAINPVDVVERVITQFGFLHLLDVYVYFTVGILFRCDRQTIGFQMFWKYTRTYMRDTYNCRLKYILYTYRRRYFTSLKKFTPSIPSLVLFSHQYAVYQLNVHFFTTRNERRSEENEEWV